MTAFLTQGICVQAVCSTCTLGELCLCATLPAEEQRRLADTVRLAWPMQSGEHIFRAGDRLDAIYALRSGWLKTYVRRVDGEERVLGFHLPGDLLGLEAIDAGHHALDAMALTDVRVCRIPLPALSRLANSESKLQQRMLGLVSRELAERNRWLASDGLSAENRVAGFLVDLVERRERRGLDAGEFRLPMSRADIGAYLNLAHETVSRSLTKFQKNGLIDVRRRKIRVLAADDLRQLRMPVGATRGN